MKKAGTRTDILTKTKPKNISHAKRGQVFGEKMPDVNILTNIWAKISILKAGMEWINEQNYDKINLNGSF